MTGNSLARACFVLLGVQLIVGFFTSFYFTATSSFRYPSTFEDGVTLDYLAWVVGGGAVIGALFQVLPGWFLITRAQQWADRLLPANDETQTYIEFTALLRIGMTLLGYYFVVLGISLIASYGAIAVVSQFTTDGYSSTGVAELGDGIVRLIAGIVLVASARRAA